MSDKSKPTVNVLEAEWSKANPRPHWTSDFWASTRPDHETEESTE